jgi:predicted DCC family thiol-disulfide oxidoreductase YuxK
MGGAPDVPRPDAPVRADTIFYDGGCGLCHGFARFVVRRDRDATFIFAPLGGRTFAAGFPDPLTAPSADSVVIRTADGRTLVRSAAVVHALRRLGGGWGVVGAALRIVPAPLCDGGYRCAAAVRRRIFAAPPGLCPVVPPQLRVRFLD